MKRSRAILLTLLAAGCSPGVGGRHSGGRADRGDNPLGLVVTYSEAQARVRVSFAQPLAADQTMFLRLRRGRYGTLDCNQLIAAAAPIDTSGGGADYPGPAVDDPAFLKTFYGPEWAAPPTDQMIATAQAGVDRIIDTCVARGFDPATRAAQAIDVQVETDFDVAWDAGVAAATTAARPSGSAPHPLDATEPPIHSAQKYAEKCVAELGEIPFFTKTGDGAYSTYSCMDSTAIPMTVTDAAGGVTRPDGQADKCDKPQYIYSLCEQGPRVAHRSNADGTHWVLLCRKSMGGLQSSQFNDIAMIGHNPLTGKTCFFQNALYEKTDGAHVPHPADKVKSESLWDGVHGGIGSGIECAHCHAAKPFIHSPWIDGARDAMNHAIVPRLGEDPDFVVGFNDAPYDIVNRAGQGWTMEKSLTSPEAAACTKCHRLGSGRWIDWIARLDGLDDSFRGVTSDEFLKFEKLHWMPPDLGAESVTAANWATSKFKKAIDFIRSCGSGTSCRWSPLPTGP